MRSKERVLRAFARQEPDRVPINYDSNPGIDRRLRDHFRVTDREGLLRALGVDFRGAGPAYRGPVLHGPVPGRQVDPLWGARTRYIEHGSGAYWDFCDFPLADADDATLDRWPMPSAEDFDYSVLADQCRQHAEFAVFLGHPGWGDIMNSTGFLFGVERMLMDLAEERAALLRFIDRRLDILLEITRRSLEAARGGIDFLWLGEDLGTQRAPMISLDMYRRLLRPRQERFVKLAKEYRLPVMIHTCGCSSWAYDDFIEMGVDVVDTLQPEARDMAPAYLKRRFGGRLAFHGCISTAGAVAHGSVEDVVADCRRTLETMMPGGGYCFAPTHALQDNSPTENVVAMYETAHRFGRYG